jgi:transmembrane sensor
MKKNQNKEYSDSEKAERLLKSYRVHTRSEQEEVLNRLLERIDEKEQKPSRKISWYITAAASAAAVAAILISFWFLTATVTVNAGEGEAHAFRLPDNSRIVLHDGSSITFRKYFWNRRVSLAGEGYFEVERGDGFLVNTRNGSVEVLGTRFLVNEMTNQLTVHCYEGKVKTSFNNNSWILEPGTRFSGDEVSAGKKAVENEKDYPQFARFSGNFQNVSLTEVLHEIEVFFDVDIQLKSKTDKRFSGKIETGSLENVLQIVCEPMQLNYAFEDKYKINVY